jgi:signal transduction histidine kinase
MTSPLQLRLRRSLPWVAAWVFWAGLAALVMAQLRWQQLQSQFDADVERVATLVAQRLPANGKLPPLLVQAGQEGGMAAIGRLEAKLPQTHPQVLAVLKREGDASWNDEALRAAESVSETTKQPQLAQLQLAKGRYTLVLAGQPISIAVQFDLRQGIAWMDWPMARDSHAMRVVLEHPDQPSQTLVLQHGAVQAEQAPTGLLRRKMPLSVAAPTDPSASATPAAAGQANFTLVASQSQGWMDWPWSTMANAALLWALLLVALRAALRTQHDRSRAAGLLQLGQLGRLNTLAELAQGVSRELQTPLKNALNAIRDTHEQLSKPERFVAASHIDALAHVMLAEEEVSHAANVVRRLEHAVQRPDLTDRLEPQSLRAAAVQGLDLLKPALHRAQLQATVSGTDAAVLAEPEALRQIIHNLVLNAVQALLEAPPGQRRLELVVQTESGVGQLTVRDNGPGMDYAVLSRIFEPFFTTRPSGLGLGLSSSESLASAMGGTLAAYNRPAGGAEFILRLRLAR